MTGHTIGQVSTETGLTEYTLRFYEKEGLLIHPIARDSASRRVYTAADTAWLRTCRALRQTGMSIDDLRRYVALARLGPDTVDDRQDLLLAHADHVRAQISSLTADLALIEDKADTYARRIRTEGTDHADSSWRTSRNHGA